MSGLIEAYKLLPGMLLARKYRLSRKIGQGGMGVVWAATNEVTGREVALKVIARPDPSLRKRLLREAQSCGALRHPNIVDVIDVARTESGEPCLIMELLAGESVAALLEARRRLDAPLAARIAHDAAGALAAAHAVQIVHRDLKPANLFLHQPPDASDFVVKVLDRRDPSRCDLGRRDVVHRRDGERARRPAAPKTRGRGANPAETPARVMAPERAVAARSPASGWPDPDRRSARWCCQRLRGQGRRAER
ncbi:protein kinase domain-containing protein [Sorangium sp. So ce1024]|uniref:protein kinase domain-containing protein n=1 Tax=Sorangium sp. So ce1024 TaxID=3133327 RepID=UPI003F018B8B